VKYQVSVIESEVPGRWDRDRIESGPQVSVIESGLQVQQQQLIQIDTTTDYCFVAFCFLHSHLDPNH
jgi:hypothetical protein